jgi:hypothetical protein
MYYLKIIKLVRSNEPYYFFETLHEHIHRNIGFWFKLKDLF